MTDLEERKLIAARLKAFVAMCHTYGAGALGAGFGEPLIKGEALNVWNYAAVIGGLVVSALAIILTRPEGK